MPLESNAHAPHLQPVRHRLLPNAYVERVLAPLDMLRRWGFQLLGARFNRKFVVPRSNRVVFGAISAVTVAAALTLTVPLWMIAVGPLLLGMPHVLADLRYLVVRPALHRRKHAWLVATLLLVGALTGTGITTGLIAAGLTLLLLPGALTKKAWGLTAVMGLLLLRWRFAIQTQALMIHLHNIIAVLLWWLWRREKKAIYWLPLVLFAGMVAAILSGLFDARIFSAGLDHAPGTKLDFHVLEWELGGFAAPQWAPRLVLLYAFAQSVHYAVWLRLLPEEDRRQPTPRSFRSSYRALIGDVGPWLLALTIVGTLAFCAWGFFNAAVARHRYLELASLHVDLELVALAAFWLAGTNSMSADKAGATA
jgi:hypothetical protein